MNNKIAIGAGILVALIFLGGVAFISSQPDKLESNDNSDQEQVGNTQEDTSNSDTTTDTVESDDSTDNTVVENETPGEFTDYNPALLSRADTGDVVLFFHASWCPTCRALESNINSNLDDIPSDLSILKLDFDTEKELKDKYGVVVQHTLVQVDSDGNQIAKWIGGNTLSFLVDKVQ